MPSARAFVSCDGRASFALVRRMMADHDMFLLVFYM